MNFGMLRSEAVNATYFSGGLSDFTVIEVNPQVFLCYIIEPFKILIDIWSDESIK